MTDETDETKLEGKESRPKKTPPPWATYKVGYARTPESGKFKPGQSGNRRGRPKGKKNFATEFREAFNKKVTVHAGDKIGPMSKRRAMIEIAINRALKGDMSAWREVVKVAGSIGEFKPDAGSQFTGGCFVLPMKPTTPEEWMAIYGDAAKGTPVPQHIVDTVNKMTRRTE